VNRLGVNPLGDSFVGDPGDGGGAGRVGSLIGGER
jgi:hypothetical protein